MSMNTTIYTGFWYNHSKGGVVGLTLTLSNLNAACLVAALAIFVQVSIREIPLKKIERQLVRKFD